MLCVPPLPVAKLARLAVLACALAGTVAAPTATQAQSAGMQNAGRLGSETAVGVAPRLSDSMSSQWQGSDPVSFQLYTEAWSQLGAGRLDEARRLFEAARPKVPPEFTWLIDDGLSWVTYYRGDLEAAGQAFRAVLASHDGAYLSRKGLGFIAVDRGEYKSAVEFLRESFRQNPYQLLTSYTVPAAKMIDAGRAPYADQVLVLAEWVYPLSADVKFLRARSLNAMGYEDRAAQMAIAAAGLAPVYIDPVFDDLGLSPAKVREGYHALGWGLFFTGDSEGSLRRFEQYIAAGGNDPNAIRGRAFANYRLENYQAAIPDLEFAARHEPNQLLPITEAIPVEGSDRLWEIVYDARSTLAWTYWQLEDYGRAKAQFERVLDRNPEWHDSWTGLGYTLLGMGREGEAAERFRKALELSPGYPYATDGLVLALGG